MLWGRQVRVELNRGTNEGSWYMIVLDLGKPFIPLIPGVLSRDFCQILISAIKKPIEAYLADILGCICALTQLSGEWVLGLFERSLAFEAC